MPGPATDLLDSQGRPLNLIEPAAGAARKLRELHPEVVFTSGRRDLRAQATAMAQNVVKPGGGRRYLLTYKPSKARDALIAWYDAHPGMLSWSTMRQGFQGVLMRLPPEEAARISRHLGGLAFDIQPVDGPAGEAIKATCRALPGTEKFLEQEGGLTRWHWQAAPPPERAPA